MPTENERKYILKLDCEDRIIKNAENKIFIEQRFLSNESGMALRVRRSTKTSVDKGTVKNCKKQLTYKQNVGTRVVEIEVDVDDRDFDDLWAVADKGYISKLRYECPTKTKEVWEVDFFKNSDSGYYFVMAEVELDEDQIAPEYLPRFIQENLIFEVPLKDSRFSNKKLCNVDYAIRLLEKITLGNKD